MSQYPFCQGDKTLSHPQFPPTVFAVAAATAAEAWVGEVTGPASINSPIMNMLR